MIGFYQAQTGEIIIDGQQLSDCSLHSIRKNIGMISQDVLLFEGSIKDNLLLGKQNASDDELCAALKRAGIGEYIASLPDGMDTNIGTGGTGLSGGQKQRIAIARIYLKDPKIIIFDEATSSLDPQTTRSILSLIRALHEKLRITVVIVTHQMGVIREVCEEVAVLENGAIMEIGSVQSVFTSPRSNATRELINA